jgi:uncharacterized membrane protein YcgQ (UPF0703/DUF1980 family)
MFKKILQNKYILYITLFIAITNILAYVYMNNIDAMIFFIIIGLLSSYFTKNMTMNLIIAIIATNIFASHRIIYEGMENKKKDTKSKSKKSNKKKKTKNTDNVVGSRIDYAETMKQAYTNLQDVLGKEGMSGLTKETKQLVNQQKNLMSTMKDIGPMVDMAKKTLSGLDMGSMKETLSNVSGMMNSLKGGIPKK